MSVNHRKLLCVARLSRSAGSPIARLDATRHAERIERNPMPFKPNYRLQRADRQRAKEEKQQKKLIRRAERDASQKGDVPETTGEAAAGAVSATIETESPR